MLDCRLFNKQKDYSTMVEWYNKRNYRPVNIESLSDFGFTVYKDSEAVCSMFLYPIPTCDWCMIRFPISNPDIEKSIRNECMDFMFTVMFDTARKMGFKKIFCTTNNKSLEDRLLKFNLVPQNEKCEHYWGEL